MFIVVWQLFIYIFSKTVCCRSAKVCFQGLLDNPEQDPKLIIPIVRMKGAASNYNLIACLSLNSFKLVQASPGGFGCCFIRGVVELHGSQFLDLVRKQPESC